MEGDEGTTLLELRQMVGRFVSERDWGEYHRPKNLAGAISIEAAELQELFQWSDPPSDVVKTDRTILASVSDEAADVMIYLLSLCNTLDIDLALAVRKKIERNRERFPPGTMF